MLPWLCTLPSIPLSFNLAAVLPRRCASRVSSDPCPDKIGIQRSSAHRLRLGLQGSLIPFAPLAVVPQRQKIISFLPSPSEFLMISTYFTTTPSVPEAPPKIKTCSITSLPPVEPWSLKGNLQTRLRNALRPINPDNACDLCITAAAGTELAVTYS